MISTICSSHFLRPLLWCSKANSSSATGELLSRFYLCLPSPKSVVSCTLRMFLRNRREAVLVH